jgi:hypothetical protein
MAEEFGKWGMANDILDAEDVEAYLQWPICPWGVSAIR